MQVRSSGGNITGTIHGDVEIITSGQSVNNSHLKYSFLHVFHNVLTFNDDVIGVNYLES